MVKLCRPGLLLLLLAVLTACAGPSGQRPGADRAAGDPAQDGLIEPLPLLAELDGQGGQPRRTSVNEVLVVQGDSTFRTGPAATAVATTALQLAPAAGELSFAIYEFALPEQTDTLAAFSVDVFDASAAAAVPVAIANFASGRWEHLTLPLSGTGVQSLSDLTQRSATDYSNSAGSCFIAVLAFDGFSVSIDEVQLFTGAPLLPPQNLRTNGTGQQETLDNRIELSWDPAAGADGYDIYYRVPQLDPGGNFVLLATVNGASTTSFAHTRDEPSEDPCPYGFDVEYKLQSRAGAELSQLFSNTATGLRSLRAPTMVKASEKTFTDKVVLEWDSVPDALF